MDHRIHHDLDPAAHYSAHRPRCPANPVERLPGHRDISIFWLGDFVPGYPDTVPFTHGGVLEGGRDYASSLVPRGPNVSTGSGELYPFSFPGSRRSCPSFHSRPRMITSAAA